MSDLIKREDAIKELSKAFDDCEPCDKEEASDIAVTTIKELPSAEPQGDYNRGYCDAVQGIADEMVKQGKHIEQNRPKGDVDADDFCSYGERSSE